MQNNETKLDSSILNRKAFNTQPYFVYFLLLSILIHTIMALLSWQLTPENNAASIKRGPLKVSLVTPEKAAEAASIETKKPTQPPKPKPKKSKPKKIQPKKVVNKPVVKESPPVKVMTQRHTEEPSTFTVQKEMAAPPKPIEKPPLDLSPPIETPNITPDAPVDMMALVKQKRAARIAAGDPGTINAREIAKAAGLSVAEQAEQRRKDNLKSGTNGIFEITSLSWREATFAFKGWTGDYSNAQLHYYSVEARTGGDIRLKIIRRMIALIREHYDGDFQWQSHRLRETITLSARPADNAGLEDFLMQEFAMQFDYYLY